MTQPDDGATSPATPPDDAAYPADPTATGGGPVPPPYGPAAATPPVAPQPGNPLLTVPPPPAYGPPAYPAPGYGPPTHPAPGYGAPSYPPPGYGAPPALSPAGQPLAGFGERLVAYLIDGLVLTVASVVVMVPLVIGFFTLLAPQLEPPAPGAEPRPEDVATVALPMLGLYLGLYLAILVITLALHYVYYVEMMFRSGQTLGKKALRLRVVPLNPQATLTRGAAAKRYGVAILAGSFVPVLSLLDGLWQLWDKPYRQCLHDKAAGTVVVKVPATW